jgi:hypothetical protein
MDFKKGPKQSRGFRGLHALAVGSNVHVLGPLGHWREL